MKQARIAIFLPDLKGGGAERVAVNLANNFANRGYQVEIVLLSASGQFISELHKNIKVIDLQVKRIRSALLPLADYLRKNTPDALIANMWPLTVISIWARFIARVPTRAIVVEHSTWSRDPIAKPLLMRLIVKITMYLTFPKADGIVTVSRGAADDMASFAGLSRELITVIYNPIAEIKTPYIKEPMAPYSWWFGSHFKLIAVGNLIPVKDYETLLSAFAQLVKHVDARLLILGEGNCRGKLEGFARRLEIESRLSLPGFVKNPRPYFRHADLHLLSSSSEGFGNVIVEALEEGTPVVSTDCHSGPREILADGKYGRLVPVGDSYAMAMAMADALTSNHDKENLKIRAQEFSIDKAVDTYESLLFPK